MTDHIPNHQTNRDRETERAAHLKDISDRARAARPVAQGADILNDPAVTRMMDRRNIL